MTAEERKARISGWNRKWRQTHRAELLIKEQAWRDARKGELREKSRRWRLGHPERSAERAKHHYHANRDSYIKKKKAYNAARRDEINAKCRAHREANLDKVLARCAKYRDLNRETLRAKGKEYAKAHPAEACARAMRRHAARRQAVPAWADLGAIKEVYRQAARMTKSTGIKHHVDHIYPLRGKHVCGLHVHENLRVITEGENCRKSNKHPDML